MKHQLNGFIYLVIVSFFMITIVPIYSSSKAQSTSITVPNTLLRILGYGIPSSGAWSPDGNNLAIGSSIGVFIYYNDLQNTLPLNGHPPIVALTWSPDGNKLASTDGKQTFIWDFNINSVAITLNGHTTDITSLVWSPNNQFLATGSRDGTIQVWNIASEQNQYTLTGHSDTINAVDWNFDGTLLARACLQTR